MGECLRSIPPSSVLTALNSSEELRFVDERNEPLVDIIGRLPPHLRERLQALLEISGFADLTVKIVEEKNKPGYCVSLLLLWQIHYGGKITFLSFGIYASSYPIKIRLSCYKAMKPCGWVVNAKTGKAPDQRLLGPRSGLDNAFHAEVRQKILAIMEPVMPFIIEKVCSCKICGVFINILQVKAKLPSGRLREAGDNRRLPPSQALAPVLSIYWNGLQCVGVNYCSSRPDGLAVLRRISHWQMGRR